MTANVQDVSNQLGRKITDTLEVNQVMSWIELAEAQIYRRYPNLDQIVADGRLSQTQRRFG